MNSARKLSPVKQLTLGAMVTAICVLCLFAASMMPVGRVVCLFLSSVCICVLTCEGAFFAAFVSFAASALLSFLLLPDKSMAGLYVLLLGHYGILRAGLHRRMEKGPLRFLLKLFYCDAFLGLGAYLALRVFALTLTLPQGLPVWALVVIAQAVFVLFDWLYGLAEAIYIARLRKAILPRR